MRLEDLGPSIERVAREVLDLSWDRQIHDRFSGIVRENEELLSAAKSGNPFLLGVRRWWATSTALVLRRHLEESGISSLRSVVERLAQLEGELPTAQMQSGFDVEKLALERLSERLRPYINSLLYGGKPEEPLTFKDLEEAISEIQRIAARAYAAITQISMRMDPVAQVDWTGIFHEAWLPQNVQMAYDLGTDGVPFDAIAMIESEARSLPNIEVRIDSNADGSASVSLINVGADTAIDLRMFAPHARTIVDVSSLRRDASAQSRLLSSAEAQIVCGQIVVEFADLRGRVYREYANIDVAGGVVRDLSPIPFRVAGRIVQSAAMDRPVYAV
jgi:hypothetical protein